MIVATIGAALYLPTLAAGPLWLDPSEFIAGAVSLGVVHPPGHPTYIFLAKLLSFIPLGGLAFRIHLFSALCGICASCVLANITFRIAEKVQGDSLRKTSEIAGVVAGVGLLISRACWEQSVRAEVYTLNLLLALLLLWLVIRWLETRKANVMTVVAVIAGLAIGNHHYLIFFSLITPVMILLSCREGRHLLASATGLYSVLLGLMALVVYAYIPIRSGTWPVIDWGHPTTLARFWDTLTAAAFQGSVDSSVRNASLFDNMLFASAVTLSQLGIPAILLAIIGWVGVIGAAWRYGALLVGSYICCLMTKSLMFIDPANPDDHGYFALAVAMCSAGVGLSVPVVVRYCRGYGRMFGLVGVSASIIASLASVYTPRMYDVSQDTSVEAFLEPIFESIPPKSLLSLQYYGLYFNGWYSQIIEGRRPDVAIVQQTFDTQRYAGKWYLHSLVRRYPDLVEVAQQVTDSGQFPSDALLNLSRPVFVQPVLEAQPDAQFMASTGIVRRYQLSTIHQVIDTEHQASDTEAASRYWSTVFARLKMYGKPSAEAYKALHWFTFLDLITALRQGNGLLAQDIVSRWEEETPFGPPEELLSLVQTLRTAEIEAERIVDGTKSLKASRLKDVRRRVREVDYTKLLTSGKGLE